MKTSVIALVALGLLSCTAQARDCGPGALGTSRTLTIKTGERTGIGHGYPALGLAKGEIILTFDDGPSPKTTPAILDTLARAYFEKRDVEKAIELQTKAIEKAGDEKPEQLDEMKAALIRYQSTKSQ